MKKIYNKQTLWSKIVYKVLYFMNQKGNSKTVEAAKRYILKISDKNINYNLPLKYGFKLSEYKEMPVYIYNGELNDNKKVLIYIHGGSYAEQAISFQIKFAKRIAEKTNSVLVMPIYPLVPEGNCLMVHSMIIELYKDILKTNKNEINLLGDSAGGGFILSFGMVLRELALKQPTNIVTMSPWVDIAMANENIYIDEKNDFICGVDGTRYFGKLWAKNLLFNDYRVSPIYGDFKNIGKITLIYGGKEIFTSECHKLSKILEEQKVDFNYIYFKNEGHDFGMLPTKEAKIVIDNIANIINRH